jgi:hypothetical protein
MNAIKNRKEILFFHPKNQICSIARRNQNMEISNNRVWPREVVRSSVEWNTEMQAKIRKMNVRLRFRICITARLINEREARSPFQRKSFQKVR